MLFWEEDLFSQLFSIFSRCWNHIEKVTGFYSCEKCPTWSFLETAVQPNKSNLNPNVKTWVIIHINIVFVFLMRESYSLLFWWVSVSSFGLQGDRLKRTRWRVAKQKCVVANIFARLLVFYVHVLNNLYPLKSDRNCGNVVVFGRKIMWCFAKNMFQKKRGFLWQVFNSKTAYYQRKSYCWYCGNNFLKWHVFINNLQTLKSTWKEN